MQAREVLAALGGLLTLAGSLLPAAAVLARQPGPERAPSGAPLPLQRPGTPAAGLVRQVFTICGSGDVPLAGVIAQADWQGLPGGSARVYVVAQLTNRSDRSATSYLRAVLRDERGRSFDMQALTSLPDAQELLRLYDAAAPGTGEVAPGVTRRHLWVFEVAPDVQALTIARARLYEQC